jgi:multidrug transporter EmrE-like cation transporter
MEVEPMPRPVVIVVGVLLWSAFIALAIQRFDTGDGIAIVVAVAVVGTAVAGWHLGKRLSRTLARVEVERE